MRTGQAAIGEIAGWLDSVTAGAHACVHLKGNVGVAFSDRRRYEMRNQEVAHGW
jgi:hypothetical protein